MILVDLASVRLINENGGVMVSGFQNLRRGLQVTMHEVINDAAKDIASRVNRVEPALNAKPEQASSSDQDAMVRVVGSATLPKGKKAVIHQTIGQAIEKTLKQ